MAGRIIRTDEWGDRLLARPLAAVIVAAVKGTPITPNGLTFIATLFGIAVGLCLGWGYGLAAGIAIVAYLVFDCTDGQLARIRGTGGPMGRIADGIGDYITAIAVHVGLIAWLVKDHGWAYGLSMGFAAGASMAWTSLLFDRYKRRYAASEDKVGEFEALLEGASGLRGFLIRRFIPYVNNVTQGRRVLDLDAYRERVGGLMHGWLWTGPTSHFLVMAVLVALHRPMLYAWVCVVPLNLLSVALLVLQARGERREPALLESRAP